MLLYKGSLYEHSVGRYLHHIGICTRKCSLEDRLSSCLHKLFHSCRSWIITLLAKNLNHFLHSFYIITTALKAKSKRFERFAFFIKILLKKLYGSRYLLVFLIINFRKKPNSKENLVATYLLKYSKIISKNR